MSAITERDLNEALKALNAAKDGWSSPPRYILDYSSRTPLGNKRPIDWRYAVMDKQQPEPHPHRIISPRYDMDRLHIWIWAFVKGIDVGGALVHADHLGH